MKRGLGIKGNIFLICGLVSSVLFMPTTLIMISCMMPTIAANVMDRTRQKSRALCVGMMNFAGTMPFLLELWMGPAPNSLDAALTVVMQPKTIIIAYVIAASGYAIETAVSGMIATMMQQRGRARLRAIEKRLEELVNRWDYYVDGSVPLDDFGFPEYQEED